MSQISTAKDNWDKVYSSGHKYKDAPPLAFVGDIVKHVHNAGLAHGRGLYVGCGNGRNYLPLIDTGLDVIGLDISQLALQQLAEKNPKIQNKLVHSDFLSYQSETNFDYIISIQVFQHGNWSEVRRVFSKVNQLLKPGGLFLLRVKSVNMPTKDPHHIIEHSPWGGFTAHFTANKKRGLDIHYFTVSELDHLASGNLKEISAAREVVEKHDDDSIKRSHLEAVWERLN